MSEIVKRAADGSVKIISQLGPVLDQRRGFERSLLSAEKAGIEIVDGQKWERAHSQGRITGHESSSGIVYAPFEVNRKYQQHGIEEELKQMHLQKAPDVEFELETVTECHPGTRRLSRIQYKVTAIRGGVRTLVFERALVVGNEKSNPTVMGEGRGFLDLEPFLIPPSQRNLTRGGGKGTCRLNVGSKDVHLTQDNPLFSPKGVARGTAIVSIAVIASAVLDFVNDRIQRQKAEDAMNAERNLIEKTLNDDPFVGVFFEFRHLVNTFGPDFAIVKPGSQFVQLDITFGTTKQEAESEMRRRPKLIPAGTIPGNRSEHNFRYDTISRWYPPSPLPAVPIPPWFEPMMGGYNKLISLLNPPANFREAYAHLDGGNMEGMLATMMILRSNGWLEPMMSRFDREAQGIFKERVRVAYKAISLAGTTDGWTKFHDNSRAMETFKNLPLDQQIAIEKVLGRFQDAS